jgi:hypothetical protein
VATVLHYTTVIYILQEVLEINGLQAMDKARTFACEVSLNADNSDVLSEIHPSKYSPTSVELFKELSSALRTDQTTPSTAGKSHNQICIQKYV